MTPTFNHTPTDSPLTPCNLCRGELLDELTRLTEEFGGYRDLIPCPCGCNLLTNGTFVCGVCKRETSNAHHDGLYNSCPDCAEDIGRAGD